jgi:hypothetical protein
MLLSTFLCIDLTSNWKIPITCRQSLKNFLTSKLSKNLCLTLRAHLLATPLRLVCSQALPILPPQLTFCKVESCCLFCDKKTSYDLLIYHTSPEVLLNIRLTVSNYTPPLIFLQGVLPSFLLNSPLSHIKANLPLKLAYPLALFQTKKASSELVGDEGLEPPTSSLSVTRSNQLS